MKIPILSLNFCRRNLSKNRRLSSYKINSTRDHRVVSDFLIMERMHERKGQAIGTRVFMANVTRAVCRVQRKRSFVPTKGYRVISTYFGTRPICTTYYLSILRTCAARQSLRNCRPWCKVPACVVSANATRSKRKWKRRKKKKRKRKQLRKLDKRNNSDLQFFKLATTYVDERWWNF